MPTVPTQTLNRCSPHPSPHISELSSGAVATSEILQSIFCRANRALMEGAWDELLIYYLCAAAQCQPIGFITGCGSEKLICLWGWDVPADSRAELWRLLLMFISPGLLVCSLCLLLSPYALFLSSWRVTLLGECRLCTFLIWKWGIDIGT